MCDINCLTALILQNNGISDALNFYSKEFLCKKFKFPKKNYDIVPGQLFGYFFYYIKKVVKTAYCSSNIHDFYSPTHKY